MSSYSAYSTAAQSFAIAVSLLFIFAEAQQPSVFRSCSDIVTRSIGYNYIKYSGSVGSVWARPFNLSPSNTTTGLLFNLTVAQIPQINSTTAGQLTVPLLIRQNFTENNWYLVCARANNTDCSQCDVVFRQSCQNPYSGRPFITFSVTKSNPAFDRIGINVMWQTGTGIQIPFNYTVQAEIKWEPFSCANIPYQQSPVAVNGLQCGRPSISNAYAVRYGDPFARNTLPFDLPVDPIATRFTVSIVFELQIGDTVRRLYPGTNIQDSYLTNLSPLTFERYANNQQVLSLFMPYPNVENDFDAMLTCTIIQQALETANGTTTTVANGTMTTVTPAPQQSAHRFHLNTLLIPVGVIAFVYHSLQLQ